MVSQPESIKIGLAYTLGWFSSLDRMLLIWFRHRWSNGEAAEVGPILVDLEGVGKKH